MKICLKPFVAAMCLVGCVSSAFAVVSSDNAQMKRLEAQLAALQKEVAALKKGKETRSQKMARGTKVVAGKHAKLLHHPPPDSRQTATNIDPDSPQAAQQRLRGRDLLKLIGEEKEYLPFDIDVPGQAFVSTGPYVGVPITYAGSNLIINSPSVNTDLQLLGIRKAIHEQLLAMGGQIFKEPYHSHLLLSGVVEVDANYVDAGSGGNSSNIDLTNVSLDAFFIGPSDWTLGFIELSYEGESPMGSPYTSTSNYTVSNSRVFINKAFVTIGDFSKSPFYSTFGQFYVPFGRYSSIMVSSPFTKSLTRTKARSILVGVDQQSDYSFYGAAYVFRGDSGVSSSGSANNRINNGGINLGYKFPGKWIHGDVGAGVIGNIADSGGMQDGNGFKSFEGLEHRVPGYNLRAILGLGEHTDIILEYVTASTRFNQRDMSYNNHGAKPSALDTEIGYSFMIADNIPSTIGVGYSKSNQALSLGLPLTRKSIVFNTSIWRNTLQSLELRRDRYYAASDTGNGPVGAATTPGACTAAACSQSGKADNAITAQFDYYF